jgi:hypothetical protein
MVLGSVVVYDSHPLAVAPDTTRPDTTRPDIADHAT